MKIIEQRHQILSPVIEYGWHELQRVVELAGRTCYQSDPEGDPATFIEKIMSREHHSVIEHANISVRFITDRGVTHELVRHRLAAYSQESTRYCDYEGGDIEFIRPVWMREEEYYRLGGAIDRHSICEPWFAANPSPVHTWVESMVAAEDYYERLREQNWSPQQARAVLPNSLKTDIVMTTNLREWLHVFNLRTSKAAHPQIRELMLPLLNELAGHLPSVFSALAKERTA